MSKRISLLLWLFAFMTFLLCVRPAYAHDCSSATDCANVIRGTGWLATLLGLLIGVAAAVAGRKNGDSGPRPAPTIHIRPHKDIGTQNVQPDISTLPKSALRVRPVFDPGEQQIEADNPLVADQRWDDE